VPISFACWCGNFLRFEDEWGGRQANCPHCGRALLIPFASLPAPTQGKAPTAASGRSTEQVLPPNRPHFLRKYAYFALLLTLVPLVFSLFGSRPEPVNERLWRTIDAAPPEVSQRAVAAIGEINQGKAEFDSLFDILPGGRIDGAHLSRKTYFHWLYAALAAAAFFGLTLLLAPGKNVRPSSVFFTGIFTGTIGVLLLLATQLIAEHTPLVVVFGGNPVVTVLYWLALAVGYSYRAALNPDNGFLPSFLGYTFGIGLCEEVCKALPVIWYYRRDEGADWRVALTWGLASGVGFGIAEAVRYSADFYNGMAPAGTYVVRFISCVGLHATWSGAVALFIHRHYLIILGELEWYEYIPRVLFLVAAAAVLHGLYDTALKKEMNAVALLAAVASFAWLAWCLEAARAAEAAAAT
jgi:RsiW-degrading membrane proteinase PrsW (M82 family)